MALGAPALAAEPVADLQRGFAAVGYSTSDEAALRAEPVASQRYRLGAALAAWSNAAATLKYDLETPSGDGDDTATIEMDCYDEQRAFGHLEASRAALGLADPAAVEGLAPAAAAPAVPWSARRSGPAPRCR